MSKSKVIVVTGPPGSGKTTLARELAARWHWPLIAKDLIKEPLLDVLGAADAAQSRQLSDASFAVLFDIARELTSAGTSFILEGNFRPGEHEAPLRRAIAVEGRPPLMRTITGVGAALPIEASELRIAQILCRVPEPERLARIQARAGDSSRHAGHRLGEQVSARPNADAFLELPSRRLIYTGSGGHTVHDALDDWINLRAPSR